MNADARVQPHPQPASDLAQAIYFRSGEHALFGWLHRPTRAPVAGVGLVICSPFGYEGTCAHRSIRTFANAAVELGVPTLRFDYLGTGDSADIDPQADQLEIWTQDVLAAIAELKRSTGVDKVCLLGIRLGALLAVLAAQKDKAIDSIILIAPIVNGRRYVREITITRRAAQVTAKPSRVSPGAGISALIQENHGIEVSGFSLSASTVAALSLIDLSTITTPPAASTLIIDSEYLSSARGWADVMASTADRVQYVVLPGLVKMIMASPLRAVVPRAMVDAARDWLQGMLVHVRGSDFASATETLPVLSLPDLGSAEQSSITERPVFIASKTMLFGIVSEPRLTAGPRRGVLLLNSGADYHIGANRLHVSLARRWARLGYVVLRLDLSGLGDSGTSEGCTDDDVFPATAIADTRAAADFLRNRYSIDSMTIGGVCSGAYHALRAAVEDVAVNQILMVNPQNFFWKKGMQIDELQLAEVVRYPSLYLQRVFSRQEWRKLFNGEVRLLRVLRVYINRVFLAVDSTVREIARRMAIRLPNDLGADLEDVAAKGVRMVFVFARGEAGISLLHLQGGSSVERLGDRCRVHILDGGDHIFSQRVNRDLMENVLTEELSGGSAPKIIPRRASSN